MKEKSSKDGRAHSAMAAAFPNSFFFLCVCVGGGGGGEGGYGPGRLFHSF